MMVKGAISQAAAALKPAEEGARRPQARLVLVVDQLEELLTCDKIPGPERQVRLPAALAGLRPAIANVGHRHAAERLLCPPGRCAGTGRVEGGVGSIRPAAPGPAEIALLVREPASAAGLRFEQDPDGQRLDDVLRDEASQEASLLPLLEFTLNELYGAAASAAS